MTRIMLRLLLLLLSEGLILLSSGETTTSIIQDPTTLAESSPALSSGVENNSLSVASESAQPPTEGDILGEKATVGSDPIAGSTDPAQTESQTSKESDEKERSTTLADGRKDPTPTGVVSETDLTTMNVRLDPKSTTPEVVVDSTEHPSESSENPESNEHAKSNENKTHSSRETTDSMIISENLLHSQSKTDAMTTYSPSSATDKRSLVSSTDSSDFDEAITTAHSQDISQPQTSSRYEESHSSEEAPGTEKTEHTPGIGISIPHRSYDLEREETTTWNGEGESEVLVMAGTEKDVRVVPPRGQSILISPHVVVMSQQHDVLDVGGTKMPMDGHYQENNVGAVVENDGVTFDPDGMTNDGPQDPDSVVFSVPEKSDEKENSGEREKSSSSDEDSREREFSSENKNFEFVNKEREEVFIANESNPLVPNGIRKFEKLEEFNTESNTPELEDIHVEVPSKDLPNPIFFENGATLPEFQIHDYTGKKVKEESEEMLQDAPHGINMLPDFAQSIPDESVVVTDKQTLGQNANSYSIANTMTAEESKDVGSTSTAANMAPVSHQPDQSVIRPVKVSFPSESIASTSILPGPPSTQSGEPSTTVSSPSVPTAGLVDKVVENSSPGSSSPILMPDPVFKISGNVEVSTLTPQPELVDSANATQSNSTISRIEVKSSVSVSLPSSDSNDGIQIPQLSPSTNSSLSLGSVDSPIAEKESNETIPPTTTEAATTGFKIRKPKLKIGADRPSRQPYVPRRPGGGGPSTEAAPPVSIFKKQRTRIASITSSTTARPFRAYSTIRVHYATHHGVAIMPELIVSTEPAPTTTTEPPTTTTEEPIEEEPFTDQTVMPVVADEADTTLVKVAGYVALDRGIRWDELLDNRQTPEYKSNEERVLLHLERLFRSSPIAARLWKIEIDGFSGSRSSRPVGVDFFLYLIKSTPVAPEHLESIFREKLSANRTFGTFRVDVDKTAFEVLQEEPLLKATPPPDDDDEGMEPPIPQWAIACIVIGAASLIFILLFAAVTLYGRHHMRRRYSSSQLKDEEGERSSGDWESKMAAAYENMAADTLYDADENTYKKHVPSRIATFHGVPSPLKRCDSWSSAGRPPRWTSHFD